jgi:hypothetical protein
MAWPSRSAVRSVAVALGFALAATACSGGNESATSSSAGAEKSPLLDVAFATSDGGQLEWGTLEGQDVVLWFWAPW